ncbi:leucine-rich repeat-containing protein 40-like [Argonauta hians]
MSRARPGKNVRKPFGANPSSAFRESTDGDQTVHPTLLKNARSSGLLNISGRALTTVPRCVLNINIEELDSARNVTLDNSGERWWDQTDLTRLFMANNCLTSLPADIRLLHALNVLDVHDNNLESVPDEIGDLLELQKLVLSRNKLTTLPPTIQQLQNLGKLKLDNNSLTDLPAELGLLTNLEELDVSNNSLATFPNSVGKLTKVRNLNLSSNQLTTLPPEIGNMKGIHILDVSSNQIETLPDELGNLGNMEMLYGQKNKLKFLPILTNCTALKELHLGFNHITELSKEHLSPLGQITLMDLRDNKLKEIPVEITLLAKLQRLDLTNNSLQGLANEIGLMENLRNLQFDGNPIRNIRRDVMMRGTAGVMKFLRNRIQGPESNEVPDSPKRRVGANTAAAAATNTNSAANEDDLLTIKPHDVCHFKSLSYNNKQMSTDLPDDVWEFAVKNGVTSVYLAKNSYTTIPQGVFKLSGSLTELHMGFNKLAQLPADIGSLVHLTFLDVRNNCLSDLPAEIGKLEHLREINLAQNRFTSIPAAVYTLPSLEILFVNGNQVAKLDVAALQELPALTTLNLQNNNLTHIQPELALCPKLAYLQLEGNALRNPRPAIIAKGSSAILDYLRDRIVK